MKINPRLVVLLVPLLLVFILCFAYSAHADDLPPKGDIENALSTETPDSPLDFVPGESPVVDDSPAPVESPLPDSEILTEPTPEPDSENPPEPTVEPTPAPTPEPTVWEKPFNEYTTTEALLFCLLVLACLAFVATLFLK